MGDKGVNTNSMAINRRNRVGMTLVEMMVALTIFGVTMAVVFTFLTNSRRNYSNVSERVEYQQSVRAVLSLVSRELRSAGCDPAGMNFNNFMVADAQVLRCRMDLDGDGLIETVEPAEDVVYIYVPHLQEMVRNSGFGPQTVLRNVTNLNFAYFDEVGNPLVPLPLAGNDLNRIRFVEIDIQGISDRNEPVNYTTRVLVRNG